MGWVDQIARALITFFEWIVNAVSQVVGKYLIQPFLDLIVYTPHPLHNGQIALFRRPTNGVWPFLYDAYFTNLWTSILFLIVGYLLMSFIQTTGIVSSYKTRRSKTDLVTAIFVLPFGWAGGALVLQFSSALTKYLMPNGPEFSGIVLGALGALAGSYQLIGVNVITGTLSLIDLIVFVIVFAIYLFRIFYLMLVMYGMPYLLAFWLIRIPVLSGISQTLLSVFVKMAFLPLIVAMGLDLTTVLISSSGRLLFGSFNLQGVAQSLVALVFPLLTLGAFYLVMQASLGRGAARAAFSAKRRYGGVSAKDAIPDQTLDAAGAAPRKIQSGIGKPMTMASSTVRQSAGSGFASARNRLAYEASWARQVGRGVRDRSVTAAERGVQRGTASLRHSGKRVRDTVSSQSGNKTHRTSKQLAAERLDGESEYAAEDPRMLDSREAVVADAAAHARPDDSGPTAPRQYLVDRAVEATQHRRLLRRQDNHEQFEGY